MNRALIHLGVAVAASSGLLASSVALADTEPPPAAQIIVIPGPDQVIREVPASVHPFVPGAVAGIDSAVRASQLVAGANGPGTPGIGLLVFAPVMAAVAFGMAGA